MKDFLVIRIDLTKVNGFYLNVSKSTFSLLTFILIIMTFLSGLETLNCVSGEIDGFHKAFEIKNNKMMEVHIEIIILKLD